MTDTDEESIANETLITLTSDIVAAHVTNNSVAVDALPTLISETYAALAGLGSKERNEPLGDPAVSIRASVRKNHVACLDCGKKMKMLKRHLLTEHGLTPEQYKARWGLSADYPLVAPNYSEVRRGLAKEIGLGRKPDERPGARKAAKSAAKRPGGKRGSPKKSAAKKSAAKKPTTRKAPAKK